MGSILLALLLGGLAVTAAGAATITSGPTTVAGVQSVDPATEFVIYSVQIRRDPPPQEELLAIRIIIEDLVAPDGPTGLTQADFNQIRVWESGDAALGGPGPDAVVGTVNQAGINLGGVTTIPVVTNILPGGGGRYYLVTVVLGPGAINGHSFRVGAPANNIDIDQNPPGPGGFDGVADVILDGVLAASNANRFEFGGVNFSYYTGEGIKVPYVNNEGRGVPMRGLWVAGLAVLAYGAWRASRTAA